MRRSSAAQGEELRSGVSNRAVAGRRAPGTVSWFDSRCARLAITLLVCCPFAFLASAPAAGRHVRGGSPAGLRPGLYTISILAPTLDPALTIDEQTLHLCYSPADAGAHANPIMPPAERKGCNSPDRLVGNVLTYDATCRDGLHNLRLTEIAPDSYVGKYLYVSKGQPRLQLEPAVRLHRDGECP